MEPPNYNFSLDAFQSFKPGTSLEDIKKKYPKSELIQEKAGTQVIKIYVAHLRYKFPVFIQFKNQIATDFLARLPSYFLHDVFHASLISRFGKQDSYLKKEESALYTWRGEKDGIKRQYFGTCTITCFPVWYSEVSTQEANDKNYSPLTQSLFLSLNRK